MSQVELAAAAGLVVLGLPLEVAVPRVEGAFLQAGQTHHEPRAQLLRPAGKCIKFLNFIPNSNLFTLKKFYTYSKKMKV